ncbi:MAG: SRPBCC family protein [Hyphomonadaceae bacterium]
MAEQKVWHGTISIAREYRASPQRVFAALTLEDAKLRWFASGEGFETFEYSVESKEGGREIWRGAYQGGAEITNHGLYYDVVENERLIWAYEMHIGGARISVSLSTIELTPNGSGTRLMLTEQGAYLTGPGDIPSREQGLRELLEALARELGE